MKAKKPKFTVPGMFIDHGAYFLRWRVNGRRHTVNVGRVEVVTKEAAEKTAHEYRSGERSVYLMGSNSGNMTFLGIFNDLCDSVGRTRWKDSTRSSAQSSGKSIGIWWSSEDLEGTIGDFGWNLEEFLTSARST